MDKKAELNRALLAKLAKFSQEHRGVVARLAVEMSLALDANVTQSMVHKWLKEQCVGSLPTGLVMIEIGRQLMRGRKPVSVLERVKSRLR